MFNSFIVSALADATAVFAAFLACLHLSLYSCLRDVSHIFIASFLALITSYTLPFHHHVSSSHWGLRPVVIPTQLLYSLHGSYFIQHLLPALYFKITFLLSQPLFPWCCLFRFSLLTPLNFPVHNQQPMLRSQSFPIDDLTMYHLFQVPSPTHQEGY